MIPPTVGRVVWFYRGNEGPLAAIVVKVYSNRCVNLHIMDEQGACFAETSVTLVQEGDEPPSGLHCRWMPYQIGQAKKYEELAERTGTGGGIS